MAERLGLSGGGTGNPEFERKFTVDGSAAALTPEAQAWLSAHPRPVRFDAGEAVVWDEGRFELERVEPALAQLGELLTRARLE